MFLVCGFFYRKLSRLTNRFGGEAFGETRYERLKLLSGEEVCFLSIRGTGGVGLGQTSVDSDRVESVLLESTAKTSAYFKVSLRKR